MKNVSILNLAEDLVDKDLCSNIEQNQITVSKDFGSKKSKPTKRSSLESLIANVAKILEMPAEELTDWIKEVLIPENVCKTILTTAKRLKLNPVLGQIEWELNQDGGYEVFIPIDGWITMIHREPSFQGVAFSQSEDTENGVPIWMECTIYRLDLTHPITVREYHVEVKTDHSAWNEMPRRMLRYKTLQQCARLAFGITIPEFKIKAIGLDLNSQNISTGRNSPLNPKDILRTKMLNKH